MPVEVINREPLVWIERSLFGTFIERINRFSTLCLYRKKRVKAYLPNSGRLEDLLIKGRRVILEKRRDRGKTLYDLLAIEVPGFPDGRPILASLDSRLPPKLLSWVLQCAGLQLRSEPRSKGGRFDLLIKRGGEEIYVETKSVNLVDRSGIARFPDAPTERGRRHIEELIEIKRSGRGAWLVFIVMREDAIAFSPFDERDEEFAKVLMEARKVGVEVLALKFKIKEREIDYLGEIPIYLPPPPFPGYWGVTLP
jgi:sugar fermentation stimulation protein A